MTPRSLDIANSRPRLHTYRPRRTLRDLIVVRIRSSELERSKAGEYFYSYDASAETYSERLATIAVYDVGGRKVRTLFEPSGSLGARSRTWNGQGDRGEVLPRGVYFLKLESGGERTTKKLVLVGTDKQEESSSIGDRCQAYRQEGVAIASPNDCSGAGVYVGSGVLFGSVFGCNHPRLYSRLNGL